MPQWHTDLRASGVCPARGRTFAATSTTDGQTTTTSATDRPNPRHLGDGLAKPVAGAGYFTAPEVRPDWICRWKIAYTMIMGRMAMVRAANRPDQSAS